MRTSTAQKIQLPRSFREVIDSWPRVDGHTSLRVFADDMDLIYGVAQSMRYRDRIDSKYWVRLAAKARERGLRHITEELLARIDAGQHDTLP